MIRKLISYGALAGVIALGGCQLDVQNPNDPETDRVLATPKDAEALLGSYYRRWHTAMYGSSINIDGMMAVMSFENYSSLANSCQNARAGIPRPANDNSISNVCQQEQNRVYSIEGEVSRVASNVLAQLNSTGFTIGSPVEDLRAKSFAEFLRGLSHGYLALFYDSAAVISVGMAGDDPGVLRGYMEVMDSAIVALDNAIVHASAAQAAGGTAIPQSWIATTATLDMPNFTRLIRSYRARLRANVARNPAERAAVNWALVIADAQNGITADHDNITNTTTGPFSVWRDLWQSYGLWHQMPPWVIGMADTSGAYETWMSLPIDSRGSSGAFFMVSPDLRFPQGASRTAQQGDFAVTSCETAGSQCERYFVNRPAGSDQGAGLSWGQSNYDFVRYHPWDIIGDGTSRNGRIVFFTRAELNLLEAEGHIRATNYGAAATLINLTRTAGMVAGAATGGGLNAVTGTVDGGLSGPDCVPKVPVNATGAGGATFTCGSLFEAMKYEKRLETIQSHFGAWFLDSRGWGDLPVGSPVHWAPPYQDLQSRKAAIYSTGSNTTGGGASGPSTYGW